jgi:excisionase family DNA binding protein
MTLKNDLRRILSAATRSYAPRPEQIMIGAETRKLFDECLELTKGDATAAANLVLADALLSPPLEPSAPPGCESLTVAEAADELRLHRETVYKMCRTGQLRSFRSGRAIRIPREGIDKIKANTPPKIPPRMVPDHVLNCPDHVGGYKPKW